MAELNINERAKLEEQSAVLKTIKRIDELRRCESTEVPKVVNEYNSLYIASKGGMPLYRELYDFLKDAPKLEKKKSS